MHYRVGAFVLPGHDHQCLCTLPKRGSKCSIQEPDHDLQRVIQRKQCYRCILVFYTQIKLVLHGTRRGNESWRGKVAFNAQVQFTNKHAGGVRKRKDRDRPTGTAGLAISPVLLSRADVVARLH